MVSHMSTQHFSNHFLNAYNLKETFLEFGMFLHLSICIHFIAQLMYI